MQGGDPDGYLDDWRVSWMSLGHSESLRESSYTFEGSYLMLNLTPEASKVNVNSFEELQVSISFYWARFEKN